MLYSNCLLRSLSPCISLSPLCLLYLPCLTYMYQQLLATPKNIYARSVRHIEARFLISPFPMLHLVCKCMSFPGQVYILFNSKGHSRTISKEKKEIRKKRGGDYELVGIRMKTLKCPDTCHLLGKIEEVNKRPNNHRCQRETCVRRSTLHESSYL